MSELPTNFNKIITSNKKIKETTPQNLNNFLNLSLLNDLTIEEKSQFLQTAIEFGDAFLQNIIDNHGESLKCPVNDYIDDFLKQFKNCGMLIIRPEMYHISSQVENFLIDNGLSVIVTKDILITYDQYVSICRDSIQKKDAKYTMPTRTMVYTGGLSKIIICKDSERNQSLADKLVSQFKGVGGVQDTSNTTIRGTIVYQEAIKLGFHTLTDRDLCAAIDPIGILRLICDFPQYQSQLAKTIAVPYLRLVYNAVAVHIPDQSEISRDLSSVCDQEWLESFSKNF